MGPTVENEVRRCGSKKDTKVHHDKMNRGHTEFFSLDNIFFSFCGSLKTSQILSPPARSRLGPGSKKSVTKRHATTGRKDADHVPISMEIRGMKLTNLRHDKSPSFSQEHLVDATPSSLQSTQPL